MLARLALLSLLFASSVAAQPRTGAVERWLAQAQEAEAAGRRARARRLLIRAARRAPDDPRPALALAAALPEEPARVIAPPRSILLEAREARRLLEPHRARSREARRADAWARAILGEHAAAIDDASRPRGPEDAAPIDREPRPSARAGRGDEASAALLRRLATLSVLRDDLGSAERALEAAHRLLPEDGAILSDLGALLLARGDAAAAVDRFARVLGRAPGDLDARRDLAGALLAAGRADEAVSLLAAGVRAHPDEPELRLELARAALEAGQPELAERAARAAIAALPASDARAHSALGEALASSGRADEARAAFAEALRRDPQDARARMGSDALSAHP